MTSEPEWTPNFQAEWLDWLKKCQVRGRERGIDMQIDAMRYIFYAGGIAAFSALVSLTEDLSEMDTATLLRRISALSKELRRYADDVRSGRA